MVRFLETTVTDGIAHDLLAEYFAERARTFPIPGGYRTTFPTAEQFEPPAGLFLVVAADDGDAVGCGGIRRIDTTDETVRYEIKHLYLRPPARGIGAGRALLAELEHRAVGFGADDVVLDTNASLAAAGGLYRSSGYAEIAPYNDNPNATHWYRKVL